PRRLLVPLVLISSGCRPGAVGKETTRMLKPLVIIDAPSNLGLRPPRPGAVPGVYQLPEALRAQGLVDRLGAADGGRVPAPAYSPEPNFETGYRNGTALRGYSVALAERTRALVAGGNLLLVLGGDCSVLLGNTLALKPLGRYGLVFIDGHDDFSPPRDPEKYRGIFAAAGRDLALATGHGPDVLTDLQGHKPYVREEDVILFGMYRDPSDGDDFDTSELDRTAIHQVRVETVRARGARAAAEEALRVLEAHGIDGFWIHVDSDVLDGSLMPAVDSPNASGLRYEELAAALGVFLSSPRAVGLEITIYDPDLDPRRAYARELADTLVKAFALAGRVDRRRAFAVPSRIAELDAGGPHPEHLEARMLYGQFVGDWVLDVTYHRTDGTSQTFAGEWHFGWILDGRAVQDVWMGPTRAERPARPPPLGFRAPT